MSLSPQPAAFADYQSHQHLQDEVCPTCEQAIPNDRVDQVRARQAEQQQALADRYAAKAKIEQEQLVNQLRDEHRREKDEALARARREGEAATATARAEERRSAVAEMETKVSAANEASASASANADELRKQLEAKTAQMTEKVAAAKAEATSEADALLRPQLVEAQKEAQDARDQAGALAVREQTSKATIEQLTLDVAAASEVGRKTAEAALHEQLTILAEQKDAAVAAKATAEQQMQAAIDGQEKIVSERVQEVRDALEKSHRDSLNLESARHFEEKLKIQNKLEDVQRQLENKTAQELGEGAEVNLFDALKAEFPEDDITRIAKGAPGADIRHRVFHNGKECGLILYDSKNHKAWRNEFLTKLREDQIADKAHHAILSTLVFPQGTKQVHLQDGVLIVNPARAVAIAGVLRQHVVQVHCLKLSNQDRDEKAIALYSFINSPQFATFLTKIDTNTASLNELQAKEKAAHNAVWNKQTQLINSLVKARADLSVQIDCIVGTASDAELDTAAHSAASAGGAEA